MSESDVRQNIAVFRLGLASLAGLALLSAFLLVVGTGDASEGISAQNAAILYVAPAPIGYDSGNNCASGSTPCATVQHAVDAADSGDEIRVANGIYTDIQARDGVTQVAYISKTVTIRGGYTTTDWKTSNPGSRPTILDAQGQGRVLYITNSTSPTIEGLQITGGNTAGYGGGVYVYNSSAILRYNVITNNTAAGGGGLYMAEGSSLLMHNEVVSNSASCVDIFGNCSRTFGGGIMLIRDASVLNHNTIISNSVATAFSDYGGGIYIGGGSPKLSHNRISNNFAADYGGGVYC